MTVNTGGGAVQQTDFSNNFNLLPGKKKVLILVGLLFKIPLYREGCGVKLSFF
jgi:hypothetical protein